MLWKKTQKMYSNSRQNRDNKLLNLVNCCTRAIVNRLSQQLKYDVWHIQIISRSFHLEERISFGTCSTEMSVRSLFILFYCCFQGNNPIIISTTSISNMYCWFWSKPNNCIEISFPRLSMQLSFRKEKETYRTSRLTKFN